MKNLKPTTIPIKNLDIGHIINNYKNQPSIILTLSRRQLKRNLIEILFTQSNPGKPFNNTTIFALNYSKASENDDYEIYENLQTAPFELI